MAKTKENQTTEIAVVENTKLSELAQKSGIELTKAEAHVSAFHPALKELSELSRALATLDKENPTAEHARIARENRLKIVKVRTGSESIKDERKKLLLIEGNLIQDAYNLVKSGCILTESEYEEIEKHQERVEAQKRAELKANRIALLAQFETDTEFLPLDIMDEEKFQALLAREKESFEAVQAKRIHDEKDRIEAERKAEEERLAEIEAEKQRQIERDAEIEELKKQEEERIKAEQNRIAKEKANAESLVKLLLSNGFELGNNDSYIESEYHTYSKGNYVVKYHELFLMKESDLLVSIGNVNTWIEQEQAKEADDKKKEEEYFANMKLKEDRFKARKPILESIGLFWDETGGTFFLQGVYSTYWETIVNATDESFNEHLESIKTIIARDKEAKELKVELEAKQLAEENERLAKISEQQEKEAAAKALLKAPDQEKVKAFFVQFTALQFPELQSESGKAMTKEVTEALQIVKNLIISHSKNLV